MTGKKFEEKIIDRSEINEELRKINGTLDYITPSGKVYKDCGNNKMFCRKPILNKANGYLYSALSKEDGTGNYQRRLHILVAESYIDNPDNLPIVMHKDNNKQNPDISNLEWGTVSKNTKNAFDDNLISNDIGFCDSQSVEIAMFDMDKNLIQTFGSVRDAARSTGLTASAILFQCNHKMKSDKPKSGYYFRYLEEFDFFEEFIL